MIQAPQKLKVAVGPIAHEIARLVETFPRCLAEGIGDEFLRRQLGAVEIAAGQTGAADVQFPRHPDRRELQVRVQNVQPRVGNRTTDGQGRCSLDIRMCAFGDTRTDRNLSRTIGIEETPAFRPEHRQTWRTGLAGHNQTLENWQVGRRQCR